MVEEFCKSTKTIELFILKGWILWYVDYISIKLLKKKN